MKDYKQKLLFITTIIIICMTGINIKSSAQAIKYRATGFSIMEKQQNGEWTEWTEMEPTRYLIVFDIGKAYFRLYLKETMTYDIAREKGMETDEEGEVTLSYLCVDNEGEECDVDLMHRKNSDGTTFEQLYISYETFRVVYYMKESGEL